MSTEGDRDRTGSGERPLTTLIVVAADGQKVVGVGVSNRVQNGREANAVIAQAVIAQAGEAGAGFLVAVPERASSAESERPDLAGVALDAVSSLQQPTVPFGLAVVGGAGGSTVVIGVSAAIEVGGFDPDEPGLGWIDFADRLGRGGFAMVGLDHRALPFVPALTGSLTKSDRAQQEGRWFRRRANSPMGRFRFERYRRRVLTDVARARAAKQTRRTGAPDYLAEIESAARQRWRAPRPDEAQQGTGRRADWRHLIGQPASGRPAVVALLGFGPVEEWQWLVDDGWAKTVTTDLPAPGHTSGGAVVVVIGSSALRPDSGVIERAAASVGPAGSVIVMTDPVRSGTNGGVRLRAGHRSAVKALQDVDGFEVRRFLALPDAAAPKRYVPLDHPGGPAWLGGPTPALTQARLPRRRRLLREVLRRLAPLTPELLGGVVVVAGPASPPDGGELSDGELSDGEPSEGESSPSAVVITSGFDEGSRTIVLPLGADGRPDQVVKITSRPAYRENAEREHRLLAELAANVEPGLVPTPLDRIDDGEIHAVVESYAGRWTMTDVLNEQGSLSAQADLLNTALGAISTLAKTAPSAHAQAETEFGAETWSHDGFDELIGQWFDRLDNIEGPSPVRAVLRRSLAERSQLLQGKGLPFGVRHFDLGPWNMVLADAPQPSSGRSKSGRSPITIVDWELAPPRTTAVGPVGADHVYFTKYWLHIAANCRSVEDEQLAFPFLANERSADLKKSGERSDLLTANLAARDALVRSFAELGVDTGFVPLLEAHVWAEAACYTSERRRGRGGDGGSPARYLNTLARHRVALLDAWPT